MTKKNDAVAVVDRRAADAVGTFSSDVMEIAGANGAIVITSDEGEVVVGELWRAGKGLQRLIVADFKAARDAAALTVRTLRAQEQGHTKPIADSLERLSTAQRAYQRTKQIAADERAKAENLAREAQYSEDLSKSIRALRGTRGKAREAVKSQIEVVKAAIPDRVEPARVATAVPTRDNWSAEVHDMAALVSAIVGSSYVLLAAATDYAVRVKAGEDTVALELLPDIISLNAKARSLRRENLGIPGVRGVNNPSPVLR